MPSELNGAMNDANNPNSHDFYSSSWEKDRLFLEDLKDVLTFLKVQEFSYDRRIRKQQEHQPRTNDGKTSNLPPFYDSWRPVMISWMYHVADTFRLMPIVVATGVYILDTCAWDLCNPSSQTYNQKELYPLITMTALNMAVKCHETKMFPLDQLVQLLGTGGGSSMERSYTPEDVSAMERQLLQRCEWKLHCPTTHDYLLRFGTVIREEHRGPVISAAVSHLKESLMWEHVLHHDKQEGGFSTCTAAYAAFLLAMEDAGLPLDDKQAACLTLLEVANLSAQTPRLSEAYNWLFEARTLQLQLKQGKNLRSAASITTSNTAVPAHASAEPHQTEPTMDPLDDSSSDQMSCDMRQSHAIASSTDVAIVEPDYDDENCVSDDHSNSIMSYGSVTSDHSIIFCSYSSDGDAVEVVATDNVSDNEEDDDESMDHSATVTVLPTVVEEEDAPARNLAVIVADDSDEDDDDDEPAKLVLSESLDEDGFEVAFEGKSTGRLTSMVSSPREAYIAL